MSTVRPTLLRQTFQDKSLIFASVAEASLDNLIYDVCRRLVNSLFSRSFCGRIFSKWFTEIYFIGHCLFQMSYLKTFGATFSENFFGLKRTSLKNGENPRLSNKEILLAFIFTSGTRYIMEKLSQASLNTQKQSIVILNALVNAANYMALTVQYIRFLSGKSEVVTWQHLAAGVKLEYCNDAASQTGNTLREFILKACQNSLGLSAFFLQFSQWWQTDRSRTGNKINIPPPSINYDVGTKCFLCDFDKKNVTLSSVTGCTFCYKCISNFVEKFKKCPITNVPTEATERLIPKEICEFYGPDWLTENTCQNCFKKFPSGVFPSKAPVGLLKAMMKKTKPWYKRGA